MPWSQRALHLTNRITEESKLGATGRGEVVKHLGTEPYPVDLADEERKGRIGFRNVVMKGTYS